MCIPYTTYEWHDGHTPTCTADVLQGLSAALVAINLAMILYFLKRLVVEVYAFAVLVLDMDGDGQVRHHASAALVSGHTSKDGHTCRVRQPF